MKPYIAILKCQFYLLTEGMWLNEQMMVARNDKREIIYVASVRNHTVIQTFFAK